MSVIIEGYAYNIFCNCQWKGRRLRIYQLVLVGLIVILAYKCKKDNTTITAIDIDGNSYTTVRIRRQVWIAENLKTTRLNDGTIIPLVNDSTEWGASSTYACCWAFNDIYYKKDYGALYNWYAINTGKLCPTGWHVPSDDEWAALISYLGGEYVAGGSLKETGTSHWFSPNDDATNETGFSALPGGYRDLDGSFSKLGHNGNSGFWWTSSDSSVIDGFAYGLYFLSSYVSRRGFSYNKKMGFSVRCLKDN